MGLTESRINLHIDHWSAKFKRSSYSFRQHWPSRLFRHEPVQNAAKILKDGILLSRTASEGIRPNDIAHSEVIKHRVDAHNDVRLYFRPRNPTQWKVEGIKKENEVSGDAHAPILVFLLFDSRKILSMEGVKFSNGNMQSDSSEVGVSDLFFSELNFEMIYSTGGYDKYAPNAALIRHSRCAEVLLPSPLGIRENIQGVVCRSHAERKTLLYFLGDHSHYWSPKIKVASELGLFESKWAYVDTVNFSSVGVVVSLHPRQDSQGLNLAIRITNMISGALIFRSRDNFTGNMIRLNSSFADGNYLIEFFIDGVLAFKDAVLLDERPF